MMFNTVIMKIPFTNIILLSYIYSIQALSVRISELGPQKVYFDLNRAPELFKDFVRTFNKTYSNETEYDHRFAIFQSNLQEINKLNKRRDSAVFSVNEFTDISPEEISGVTMPDLSEHEDGVDNENDTLVWVNFRSVSEVPKEWDWRSKGVVAPVRNQGRCNSCWAFASVSCIESQNAIKSKKLIDLSQQQLVDCLGMQCKPYFPHKAMKEVAHKMGGLMTYSDYPYNSVSGSTGRCKFNKNKVAVKVRGGTQLHSVRNEEQLKQLVQKYGPVVVGIHASPVFWHFHGGLASADSLNCRDNMKPNHAVVIVGYSTENGVPYWIVKNSGGPSWGEQGYMRLLRGRNTCNILHYITIAEL